MHIEALAWALGLALVVPATSPAQQPSGPISVCDLLRDAQRFDGQLVKVRGVLRDSNPTGKEPAYDELITDGCSGLETDRVVIRIEPPDAHFLEEPPQGYEPDMGSVRRLEAIITKMVAKGQRAKPLSLTVEGMFYNGGPKPDASERPHHRWYPGYIVIQAYRDVKPL